MSEPEEIYDAGESFAVGDDEVDWSQVDTLAEQIQRINAIEDDNERLEAAMRWADELAGG